MRPVTLATEDLVLRPPREEDVDQVLAACQDPAIARWTTVPAPYGPDDALDWVTRVVPRGWARGDNLVWYAVRPDRPERILASIALHPVDPDQRDAEIGYWTVPEARGAGIATAAVRLLCHWAFDGLGLDRIDWTAAVGNDASWRVARAAGFRREGTCRSRLALGGAREDSWVAGLLAGEVVGPDSPVTATVEAVEPRPADPPAVPDGGHGLSDVEITAGTLHLRPWHEGDVPALVPLVDDPLISLWNPIPREGDASRDAARFVERRLSDPPGAVSFAVVDATTGELLGAVTLHHLDRGDRSGEVGFWTVPSARGRGVARHAVGTVSRWAFGALGLERLELFHAVGNDASCRVAQAAGFGIEATLRQSYRYGDGERHDEHLHGRVVGDPGTA